MRKTNSEEVKQVLRGYIGAKKQVVDYLSNIHDWQRIAQQEIERRAAGIVQVLDDETLADIAAGKLDMGAVCREVAAELRQDQT